MVSVYPACADAWFNLGYLLKRFGKFEEALQAYANALTTGISHPEQAHLNRAVIYSDHLRRDAEAERELAKALAIDAMFHPARLNLGLLFEEQGKRDEARGSYQAIVSDAKAPQALKSEALARLAHLATPRNAEDPLLEQMRQAVGKSSGQARANLLYAIGRTYDRLGLYEAAFAAFVDANVAARPSSDRYDRSRVSNLVDRLIHAFPQPVKHATDDAAQSPLFICGMFRSGSTLTEQILAAHPLVTAGGELDLLPRMVGRHLAPFPAAVEKLQPQAFMQLASEYRVHVQRLFPGNSSRYITDKRPDNFLLIGLIKTLFPSARIIHTLRNPLDNALSIFMQHLDPRTAPYSFDLGDIAHFHGQYSRLMRHWKLLYPDDIVDIDYDQLVEYAPPHLERLLAFLGLPWDDECLRFHELQNTVKTASYWQVREPLNRQASGRWRNYERFLAPVIKALSAEGVLPPAPSTD